MRPAVVVWKSRHNVSWMLDFRTLVVLSERDGQRCLRWKGTQIMGATALVVDLVNVFDKVQLNVVWGWSGVLAGMSLVCTSR